jgi:transcriptional repressor NrdR
VPFERDKLSRSFEIALRKRPVDTDRIERMVTGIVRQLESQGDSEVPAERIGELVMEGLKSLDSVAYVRYASVYRNFREARDFENLIDELNEETPDAVPDPDEPAAQTS